VIAAGEPTPGDEEEGGKKKILALREHALGEGGEEIGEREASVTAGRPMERSPSLYLQEHFLLQSRFGGRPRKPI
jgi:hypothetical protein